MVTRNTGKTLRENRAGKQARKRTSLGIKRDKLSEGEGKTQVLKKKKPRNDSLLKH